MKNSKLVRHIALLNKKERNKLHNFLCSPYLVNTKEHFFLLSLYDIIQKHLSTSPKSMLRKEDTYKKIYPNEDYVKGKLEKLMTSLSKYFNQFLELEHYFRTKKRVSLHLAQANFFREKKAHKEFEKIIQKGRSIQKGLIKKKFSDYYVDFLLEQEDLLYRSLLNNSRNTNTNLSNAIEALDIYYLSQRLEYTARIKLQNYYTNVIDEQVYAAKKALTLLTNNDYLNIPLIEAYSCALSLYKDSKFKGFDTFEYLNTLLYDKKNLFSKSDSRNLKIILRTYALTKYSPNQKKKIARAFDLYKRDLKEGILYYNNKLHLSTIRNIVVLGLELKKNKWVYDFLQTHKDRIMGIETPQEVFNFNMAIYHFHTQQYTEALNLIEFTYKDIYYKVAAKRLEIKILFEQSSPILHYRIDAFKIFIFRQIQKSLSENQLKANNNFIDAIKKTLAPKTLNNQIRIDKLCQKITNTKFVFERKWLLEKLEEQK